MKKFLVCMLSLAMALALAFGLAACDNGEEPGGGSGTFSEIAGDYSVDLSGAGMPMTVYLRIGSDGAFVFSSTTGFTDSKSAGNVSKLSNGYMMLFTSVNGEAVETGTQSCNFTKESDNSLKFDGRIPYGTANFTSPVENEDTGEMVTIYAVPLSQEGGGEENTNTVTAGVYYVEHETTGTMQTTYKYYLTLREDGKFTAFVTYSMGENTYIAYDYGTYSASGAACRMTSSVYDDPDDANNDLTESLTVDAAGVYTAVKMSRMASDTVSVTATKLNAAPTEIVAAYEGTHSLAMGEMSVEFDLSLDIYADGSYTFTATTEGMGGNTSTEEGFIGLETAVTDAGILLPDGMTSPANIALDGDTGALTGSFSLGAGSRQTVTLTPAEVSQPEPPAQLTEIVPGVYYGEHATTGAMATTYEYYITLQEGNTYKAFVSFAMMGSTYSCYDYGTYAVTGGTECALTSSVYDSVAQSISLEDGTLSGNLRMSSMAQSNAAVTLDSVSAPTDVFMTYTASYPSSSSDTVYGFELKVLVDGSYTLTCDTQMMGQTFTETGYIGLNLVSGNGIMFPDGGQERTVTVADDEDSGITTLQFQFSFGPLSINTVFTPAA